MTMKGRRPKGWVNPYKRDDRATIVEGDYLMELESCFEAGADAMLEALRNEKLGRHGLYRGVWQVDPTSYVFDNSLGTYPLDVGIKGTLVFIPD